MYVSSSFPPPTRSLGGRLRWESSFQRRHLPPAQLGHGPGALPGLHRLLACGVACERARLDALEDGGRTEHVVGHAEGPVLRARRREPRVLEIAVEVFAFGGYAERGEVGTAQPAEL